jgi:hypothetical protein
MESVLMMAIVCPVFWHSVPVQELTCPFPNWIIVQQDVTVFSLLHICRQLYMFWVFTPIIRSTYNCIYSFWHWSTGSVTMHSPALIVELCVCVYIYNVHSHFPCSGFVLHSRKFVAGWRLSYLLLRELTSCGVHRDVISCEHYAAMSCTFCYI